MSEINDIDEINSRQVSYNFNIIEHYQRKYPGLMDKLKCATYQRGSFQVVSNNNYKLIMFKGGGSILNSKDMYISSIIHTSIIVDFIEQKK